MSAATVAYGLLWKKGSTAIAEITNIDGPNVDRDAIEVTSLSSPSQAKEFIMGLIDCGEVSIDVNYLPQNATHKQMLTDLTAVGQASATYNMTLTDSGASVLSASFYVKSFKLKGAVADKLGATFTFKGTGPVTFPA